MEEIYFKVAEVLFNSKNVIALTGAGISVESGIPDFRSKGGLWEKYDPSIYAAIESFYSKPEMVWDMVFDMIDTVSIANPNPAHVALAQLEEMGILKSIITQNIDNLHQAGGSKNVIEYHGNTNRLYCTGCDTYYKLKQYENDLKNRIIPRCKKCNKILKPDVIFFVEMIPLSALVESQKLAESAEVLLVVGTSAVVYPAAGIPMVAKRNRATIIEFDISGTGLTENVTDIFVKGPAGVTLPGVVAALESIIRSRLN